MELLNRALAFHDVLSVLDKAYRAHFETPRLIPVHPEFAKWPDEKAWVMVREGTGAIGLHDALSSEERRQGKIPWHFGRFLESELSTLFADSTVVSFPPEKESEQPRSQSRLRRRTVAGWNFLMRKLKRVRD